MNPIEHTEKVEMRDDAELLNIDVELEDSSNEWIKCSKPTNLPEISDPVSEEEYYRLLGEYFEN